MVAFCLFCPNHTDRLGNHIRTVRGSCPKVGGRFWIAGLIGGICQILATICVVALFKARNFAVGIALKKTETIQSVFLGLIILNEPVGWAAFALILIGVLGVIALSDSAAHLGHLGIVIFNRASGLGYYLAYCLRDRHRLSRNVIVGTVG